MIKAGQAQQVLIPAQDGLKSRNHTVSRTPQPILQHNWDIDESDDWKQHNRDMERTAEKQSRRVPDPASVTPLIKRQSPKELQKARSIVQKAVAESGRLNGLRLAKPRRNKYGRVKQSNSSNFRTATIAATEDITPLLEITDEILDAAALVAEAESVEASRNITKRAAAAGTFWMGSIQRKGTVPWGESHLFHAAKTSFLILAIISLAGCPDIATGNDTTYRVFRNVLDFGAVGDGVTVRSPVPSNHASIQC